MDSKRTRLKPEQRQQQILVGALKMVEADGIDNLTRESLAECVGVSPGTISHSFGDMDGLRDAIFNYAIDEKNALVLAEAIRIKHPIVDELKVLNKSLHRKAVKALIG